MSVARYMFLLMLSLIALGPAVQAKGEPGDAGAQQARSASEAAKERAAEDTLSAVVHVTMKAIAGARSNEMLGSAREGTGVVIDDQDHIVTIGYIVMEADSIEVTTQDNRTVPATVTAYDAPSGFALLHASVPLRLKPMALGSAANLEEAEPVMVLPSGGRKNASIAYVMSKRPFSGSWEYQLDTAIFTAPPTLKWAGAALVNHEGKLVGIGSLLVRDTLAAGSGLPGNMFVPVDVLKPILPDLIAHGKRPGPPRPWLGIATEEVQGRLFVTRVSPGGPADLAGVKAGDIVLSVGGDTVKTHDELYRKIWGLGPAGIEVPMMVLQGTDLRELKLRSIDRVAHLKARPAY